MIKLMRTLSACLLAAAVVPAVAAQPVPVRSPKASPASTPAEQRTARAYEAALKQGPLAMQAFLAQFPKGADLHVHLSGAIYAETFIRDAAEDGKCVDTVELKFTEPPCAGSRISAKRLSGNITSADQDLYDRLIDSFSMRSFVPTNGFSGHDQFFATFARFGGLDKSHGGEWVDEVASRAAAQNEQYLELMDTPPFGNAIQLSKKITIDPAHPDFAAYRDALLKANLRDEVSVDRERARTNEASRRQLEHCDTPQPAAACAVTVRYIYQVLRGFAPEQVFAQTLLGFETAKDSIAAGEPGFVGINFVQPEDGFISMRDYTLQMKMVEYLHSVYPTVHISLHAGELAPGQVPPEGLRFHIRQAVELAHAERIGHGVDALYEDNAQELLKELAAKHIMVEINLTSNDGILGIAGAQHPFMYYRAAHVPVALSTDDEGVSRINLTNEYVRAALEYGLTYAGMKQLARTGMEHNFLPGPSLWATQDDFYAPAGACKGQTLGGETPSATCKVLLTNSQKAAAQWEQERRFHAFEAKF